MRAATARAHTALQHTPSPLPPPPPPLSLWATSNRSPTKGTRPTTKSRPFDGFLGGWCVERQSERRTSVREGANAHATAREGRRPLAVHTQTSHTHTHTHTSHTHAHTRTKKHTQHPLVFPTWLNIMRATTRLGKWYLSARVWMYMPTEAPYTSPKKGMRPMRLV